MKYLTKIASKRRYMRTPEFISGTWLQDQWKLKNPALNWETLPLATPGDIPEPENLNTVEWNEDDIQSVAISWNCHLQLTDGVLNYKFTNTTENKLLANINIPISNFDGAYACTIYRIDEAVIDDHFKNIASFETTPRLILKSEMVNSTSETLPTRASFELLPKWFNLVFWVNKDDPTADDIIPVIIRPRVNAEPASSEETHFNIQNAEVSEIADHTVTFTGNVTKHESDPVDKLALEMLPPLQITSSSVSGDVVTVNFSTGTNISTIYLGQDVGYLPKTSVPVTNGTGSFKVVTTGLDTGEEVKVKMGHKYWSNQLTFTKTL